MVPQDDSNTKEDFDPSTTMTKLKAKKAFKLPEGEKLSEEHQPVKMVHFSSDKSDI